MFYIFIATVVKDLLAPVIMAFRVRPWNLFIDIKRILRDIIL